VDISFKYDDVAVILLLSVSFVFDFAILNFSREEDLSTYTGKMRGRECFAQMVVNRPANGSPLF
jgi:hypothetical protein